jgi:hypothetical protein
LFLDNQYLLNYSLDKIDDSVIIYEILEYCIFNSHHIDHKKIWHRIIRLSYPKFNDILIKLISLYLIDKLSMIHIDMIKLYTIYKNRDIRIKIFEILFEHGIKITPFFLKIIFSHNDADIMNLFLKYNINVIDIINNEDTPKSINTTINLLQQLNLKLDDYHKIMFYEKIDE